MLELIRQANQAAHAARAEMLKLRMKGYRAKFDELKDSLRAQRELQLRQLGSAPDNPTAQELLRRFDQMQAETVNKLEAAKVELEEANQQAKQLISLRKQQDESALGRLHRQSTYGDINSLTLAVEVERAHFAQLAAQRALAELKGRELVERLDRTARLLRERGQSEWASQLDSTSVMLDFLATPEPPPARLRLSPAKTAPFSIDENLLSPPANDADSGVPAD